MGILTDGFSTTISFSGVGTGMPALLFEKEVTPPGISAGGENDTTTMRNTVWRTKAPRSLITLLPASFVAAYDTNVLDELVANTGVNQQIIITFPDESTWTFYGWLDEFVPNPAVEGAQPTANCTIIPSNMDDTGTESPPSRSP